MSIASDIVAAAGVGLIGFGLWMEWPWLSLVVVGSLLLVASVQMARNQT